MKSTPWGRAAAPPEPAAPAPCTQPRTDSAAHAVVEVSQVAPIGIRNDGAVAACERRAEQLPDGGALAGAGGAYQFEMLDLVLGCDREPRERQSVAREAAPAGERAGEAEGAARGPHGPSRIDDDCAALLRAGGRPGAHLRTAGEGGGRRANGSADC